MASSTTKKLPCATCGKAAGLFTCRGCAKDFCISDASKHRQTLNQQMDEVILDHDILRQSIAECTEEPGHHPLIKQIDDWERESINKIHQTANDARQQILTAVEKNTARITETLEQVKQQLSKARDGEQFFETDLEEWKKKIDILNKNLTEPSTSNIRLNENSTSFISKIIASIGAGTDSFEQPTGDIGIEDNGQLIVHGQTSTQAAVRGKDEYSWGQHRFRFKIGLLDPIKWMFFGIVSKDAPMQKDSYTTPTTYGWAGRNQVYINGVNNLSFKNYESDMNTNDTLELCVDCDRQIICLTNERTKIPHELNVDVTKCPFPWQLSLNLYNLNDRVRIL